MRMFMGSDLEALARQAERFPERDAVERISNYLDEPVDERVCVLYGLRRTGKTVMMLHAIADMPVEKRAKTAFVLIGKDEYSSDVLDALWDLKKGGIEFMFVDEATCIVDFVKYSDEFANTFATSGIHLVFAGTDSMKFYLAESNMLGRMETVKTTRIPFAEQRRLVPGLTFSEYAKTGGVLFGKPILRESDKLSEEYSRIQSRYTLSAVAANIQHSLESFDRIWPGKLGSLCKQGEMESIINLCAHHDTHEMILRTMNRKYKSDEVSEFVGMARGLYDLENLVWATSDHLNALQKEALSILEPDERKIRLTSDILNETECLFHEIGMLAYGEERGFDVSGNVERLQKNIFRQPSVRWGQVETLVNIIETLNKKSGYPISPEIIADIGKSAHGKTFEEAAFLEVLETCGKRCDVFKIEAEFSPDFHGKTLAEADIVVSLPERGGFCAYEIKRHKETKRDDSKHLRDERFMGLLEREYGPCLDAAVLCPCEENGKWHRNIDDFILNDLPTLADRMEAAARDGESFNPK